MTPSIFLQILKHADITPLCKKGKKDIKRNYRPVSIFPNLSKIFEKCMLEQKSQLIENKFWKYQCGFEIPMWQSLLAMLRK